MSQAKSPDEGYEFTYEQLALEVAEYNRAVKSFNKHLEKFMTRRGLHDLPYRYTINVPQDEDEMQRLLSFLLGTIGKDSTVRSHPRTLDVHKGAVARIVMARNQLVNTLEGELKAR